MSREAIDRAGLVSSAPTAPGRGVLALIVSSPDDAWLVPDDPFLNAGCRVVRASGLTDASEKCAAFAPQLVFLPLTIDGQLVTRQLEQCRAQPSPPVVVVIASNDQINAAAEAMRAGAYDCLFRPFSTARLAKAITGALKTLPQAPAPTHAIDALEHTPASGANTRMAVASPGAIRVDTTGLLSTSPQMRAVLDRVQAVAGADASVFISGEIGTGKSKLAHMIHENSPRAEARCVVVDCATLSEQRFEHDILGPDGAARLANGGTLYLDEVCELHPDVQPALLHLVDKSHEAGSRANLRFIASTRHDPREAIRQGRLRADLYYRLHVAPIAIPPLRERSGDIGYIAQAKLGQFSDAEGRHFIGFSHDALALLEAYSWPGNVRELLNVIWTAVLLHDGPVVTVQHLPPEIVNSGTVPQPPHRPGVPGIASVTDFLVGRSLAEIEQVVIEATIRAEGGSVPRAARVLDVSPSTLYRKREAWERKDKD